MKFNDERWERLTEREIELLKLLAEGLSNQQIADQLCITIRTVKFHTNKIYAKMMVRSRVEAIASIWKQRGASTVADD
jgi:NarL family two-component system response regulator LiaR